MHWHLCNPCALNLVPHAHNTFTGILAGHSHFFRALVREHLAKEYIESAPEWTGRLHEAKLGNGACLCIDVEWRATPLGVVAPAITNATLMFDTTLADDVAEDEADSAGGKKKGGCSCSVS